MLTKRLLLRKISWICVAVVSLLLLSACTDKDVYTIAFETQGGSAIEDITFNINDPLTELPKPTKEGYIFSGWFLDETFNEAFNLAEINDQEIVLFAKWIGENESIAVTYDTLGGSPNQMIDVTVNEIPEPYAPRKDGYVFVGWYLDETFDILYAYEQGFIEDTTLYAKWEEKTEIVLTIVISDELSYEFNIADGKMPELDGVVPSYIADNIFLYFNDARMIWRYDETTDITSSHTIYAKIYNHSYIYYEEIRFDEIDQIISEKYALRDGVVYYEDRSTQHKTSNEIGEIWRPVSTIIESGIQGQIESIYATTNQYSFLINLIDGTQKVVLNNLLFDHSLIEDLSTYINLNENEKVTQIVPVGDAFVFLTDQKRVILDGEVEYKTYTRTYDSLDVTEEFQLADDEDFDVLKQVDDTMSLTTTKGRIFSFSALLWTYHIFEMTVDDLNKTFMEVTELYIEDNPIIHLLIDPYYLLYMTENGYFSIKNTTTDQMLGTLIELLDGEIIKYAFEDIIITSLGRVFNLTPIEGSHLVTPVLNENLTIESYKVAPHGNFIYLLSSNGEIFVSSNRSMTNITQTFNNNGIIFEDMILHYGDYIEYEGQFYKPGNFYDYEKVIFGFSSYDVSGPYETGEEVELKVYEDDHFELSGYIYDPSAEKLGFINMPDHDLTLDLYTQFSNETYASVKVNGETRGLIWYRYGDIITLEDIEPFIDDTEMIDFIVNLNFDVKIELPYQTFDETRQLAIEVFTKVKDEAIPVEVHYSSEDLYFGSETYYGLVGDELKDIVDQFDMLQDDISGIYQDEAMTTLFNPEQDIEPGMSLYVLTKAEEIYTITLHFRGTDTLEIPFSDVYYMSTSRAYGYIRDYYNIGYYLFDVKVFLDESHTEQVSFLDIKGDIDLWVTFELSIFIDVYEVDLLGNVVSHQQVLWFEEETLTPQQLSNIIYGVFPYEVKGLYYDSSLEQEVVEDAIDLDQHREFYFTKEHREGVSVNVHMYDLSKTYIETIEIYDRYYGLSDYLLLYGYDDVKLYTNDTFGTVYTGESYEGLELYGLADELYVNLTIIDTDFNETYELRYPKRNVLDYDAIRLFLINQNPMSENVTMYKNEALTESAVRMTINEDTTIYIKHQSNETMIPVAFYMSGIYEESFILYIGDNRYVSYKELIYERLSGRYNMNISHNIKLYEDAELTSEIIGFVPNETDDIYIHITKKPTYSITFIDADTSEIISVIEKRLIEDESYELKDLFNDANHVPESFRDKFILEFYEDEALTILVDYELLDSDKTYYVVRRLPELITITYKFSDPNLDDLIIEAKEASGLYQDELFRYLYNHYGSMQHIDYNINPFVSNDYLYVDVSLQQLYVVEFIYALEGQKISERILFKEGDILDDSMFMGKLYDNPNEHDVYFYLDESFTDGSLTVIVNEDMTLYLKVVRKY